MLFSSFLLFFVSSRFLFFFFGEAFLGKDFLFAISSSCESAGGRKLDASLAVSFFSRAF